MAKELINVTDIVSYLYCPRKTYLKRIKKIREKPTKQMISGFLKHKIFDIFNKNEIVLVSGIKENITKEKILEIYKQQVENITKEISVSYQNMLNSFYIDEKELLSSIQKLMEKELLIRAEAVKKYLDLGFLGKELWRNLKPKYLTEFEIVSEELGLKGRIDRIKIEETILPYEIKTRGNSENIYESDKIQLAAYSLLLEEEFHKKIEKGVIETSSKQQEVQITEEMKQQVLDIAEKIRNIKEEFPSNFNKCENCKLKDICFED